MTEELARITPHARQVPPQYLERFSVYGYVRADYSFTVFIHYHDDALHTPYYIAVPGENVTRDGAHHLPEPQGVGETPLIAIRELLHKMIAEDDAR